MKIIYVARNHKILISVLIPFLKKLWILAYFWIVHFIPVVLIHKRSVTLNSCRSVGKWSCQSLPFMCLPVGLFLLWNKIWCCATNELESTMIFFLSLKSNSYLPGMIVGVKLVEVFHWIHFLGSVQFHSWHVTCLVICLKILIILFLGGLSQAKFSINVKPQSLSG